MVVPGRPGRGAKNEAPAIALPRAHLPHSASSALAVARAPLDDPGPRERVGGRADRAVPGDLSGAGCWGPGVGAAPVRPARVTPKSHGATTKQGRPKKNKSRKTIYRTCPEPTPEVQASSWARDDNTGLPSHRRGEARLRKSDCGLKSRELLHHSSRKHKSRDPRQLTFAAANRAAA